MGPSDPRFSVVLRLDGEWKEVVPLELKVSL
jgi:hypothetical protein